MHFKVTAQYVGARELPAEQFNDLNQAKAFIEAKIRDNNLHKVKVIYRLYEWDDLLQEFDPSKMDTSDSPDSSSGASSGGGKGASFRPTPLNTAPRPPGSPPNWLKEDENDKDKQK